MTEKVALFVYPGVEVLDFAGPFEVFSTATRVALRREPDSPPPLGVFTVAAQEAPVMARGGLRILPDWIFNNHPRADHLIIPGGDVAGELENPVLLEWIRRTSARARLTASICTGLFLLAEAGILRRGQVTTHAEDQKALAERYPDLEVISDRRWVDQGRYLTSAGISAGIDMCLHMVERRLGPDLAEATARQMEYHWDRNGLLPGH